MIAAVVTLLVTHGLRHGTLWHDSLTFRWRYWVGSYRVLTAGFQHSPRQFFHFLLGVGWENFGPYYLAKRLPVASEEIRDPHNFIIRVFVELGVAGGALLLAGLARLAWELTRPPRAAASTEGQADSRFRPGTAPRGRAMALLIVAVIAIAAIAINMAISLDFSTDAWYVFLEIARRGVYLCALLIGLSVAAFRLPARVPAFREPEAMDVELDDRPAPWILRARVGGAGDISHSQPDRIFAL